jgi:hypothetical protein
MSKYSKKEVTFKIYCKDTRETLPVKYAYYDDNEVLVYVKDAQYYDVWEDQDFYIVE